VSKADAMGIAAIDFEASCLPGYGRSFPIEVALCRVGGDVLFSAIIKPHADWADWDWDPAAERMHGVSRARLAAEGMPCLEVMMGLNEAVGALQAMSDSTLDQTWLETLAIAAGVSPAFEVLAVSEILAGFGIGPGDEGLLARASERAFGKFPQIHRAGPDALRLAETIRLVAIDAGVA